MFTPFMYCTGLYKVPFFFRKNGTFQQYCGVHLKYITKKWYPPKALRRSTVQEISFITTFTYSEVARNQRFPT